MKNRKDRYLSSLTNGYILLVIQIAVSLVQVPLALEYLGKETFGLWALTAQIALWFQLLDLGMNGAVSRHLIDYVGGNDAGNLKSCLATGFRVLVGQGFLVVLVTIGLAFFGAPLFGLSGEDVSDFRGVLLILGLSALIRFGYKILSAWLYALQRLDIVSGVSSILVITELIFFWLMLRSGVGLYALAWARIASVALGGVLYVVVATKITDFPWRMLTAPFDRVMFGKLAVFGGGMFALTLGSQLLTMSQTALVSNRLGLAAAAVWATAPKVFALASQGLAKLWDYKVPYLSMLMVEGQKQEILIRFVAVFKATAFLGGVAIGGLVAMNPKFLTVWTSGVIHWPPMNDVLIGLVIYIALLVRCFTDFVLHTKKVGWMPALILLEGLLFVLLSLKLLPIYGLSGMLAASLAVGGVLRLPYALCLFRRFLNLNSRTILKFFGFGLGGLVLGGAVWCLLAMPEMVGTFGSPLSLLVCQGVLLAAVSIPFAWMLVVRDVSGNQKREARS